MKRNIKNLIFIFSILSFFFLGISILSSSNANAAERNEKDFVGAAYNGIVANCNEWITLRYAPSVDSPSLAKIPLGTIVVVYDVPVGFLQGFVPVNYNGINGYCIESYIKYHSGGGAADVKR